MVYAFGIGGFILGFIGGMFIINMFLRGYNAGELLKNKSLRWSYGLAVWIFAALGSWAGVWLHNRSIIE